MSRRYRTAQHKNVLLQLEQSGRFVLSDEFVCNEMNDDPRYKQLVMEAYNWLAHNMSTAADKPEDALYPIWLSLNSDSNYPPSEEGIVIELEIPNEHVVMIGIEKWGHILDYRYIPIDEKDEQRHRELCEAYRVSDTKAYMSNFYPDIKREIIESWGRVFDTDGIPPELCYGLVWELRKEWMK